MMKIRTIMGLVMAGVFAVGMVAPLAAADDKKVEAKKAETKKMAEKIAANVPDGKVVVVETTGIVTATTGDGKPGATRQGDVLPEDVMFSLGENSSVTFAMSDGSVYTISTGSSPLTWSPSSGSVPVGPGIGVVTLVGPATGKGLAGAPAPIGGGLRSTGGGRLDGIKRPGKDVDYPDRLGGGAVIGVSEEIQRILQERGKGTVSRFKP